MYSFHKLFYKSHRKVQLQQNSGEVKVSQTRKKFLRGNSNFPESVAPEITPFFCLSRGVFKSPPLLRRLEQYPRLASEFVPQLRGVRFLKGFWLALASGLGDWIFFSP